MKQLFLHFNWGMRGQVCRRRCVNDRAKIRKGLIIASAQHYFCSKSFRFFEKDPG